MKIFGPKSLDDILASFNKIRTDLSDFIADSSLLSEQLVNDIANLTRRRIDVEADAERANRVLDKLDELLS